MSRTRKVILVSIAAAVACSAFYLFVSTRMWQRWDMDADWANKVIADSQEIRQQLEEYKSTHGEFPDSLSRIQSEYRQPTDFDDLRSAGKWFYLKLDKNDYQLFATGKSWISSFDALVFRYSGAYPEHWFKSLDSYHSKQIGDWYYLTGFSSLESEKAN